MKFYILVLIAGSIIFLIAFFKGVFYIIKKPQTIINKKLRKVEKLYEITNVNEYLSNLGKLNLYSSTVLYIGLIIAFYADIYKYQISMYIYILFYFAYFYIVRSEFERKIEKFLIHKNTKTRNK